jgi:hypothetical protein
VRAVLPIWEAVRRRGLDPATLAVGTGYPITHLTDPRERISWAGFHRVMTNLGALIADDELVRIGGEAVDSPFFRAMMLPGRYLFGAKDVYGWLCGPDSPARRMFAQTEPSAVDLGPGKVRVDFRQRPGYEPSRENYLLLKGTLIAFGTAIAGEPARVTMHVHEDGARYDVEVAEQRRLLDAARPYMKPAVDWFRRRVSLQRAHRELHGRYAELEREVNARIVVENELRRSEERYRELFDRGPLPMWVFDVDTLRFLHVNTAAIRHYGYTRDEFLAMTILDIRPPEDVPAVLDLLGHGGDIGRTWRHRKRDGSLILVEITTHSLGPENPRARLVLANDVTARVHLEDQLRESQKLEAVGQLAGGVAHDFNNLLTVIINSSELRLRDRDLSERARCDLEAIRAAAERGAELTRTLLTFSRRQLLTRKLFDIGVVLREMQPLLARIVRDDVRVVVRASRSVALACLDRESLERVVMNLVVNARDAMPSGGTVTLEANVVELDAEAAQSYGFSAPGAYAVIAVTDSGVGMDEATRAKIFEPYFTTKPEGQGTGLGLATVRSIVDHAGGHLRVDSGVGRGTRFEIYFPIESVDESAADLAMSAP